MKSDMILLLVVLFFILGCTFDCNAMNEFFSVVSCGQTKPGSEVCKIMEMRNIPGIAPSALYTQCCEGDSQSDSVLDEEFESII